jgi:hypothetical protein
LFAPLAPFGSLCVSALRSKARTVYRQKTKPGRLVQFKGGSHSLHKGFDAVSQALSLLGPGQSNNQIVVQHQPQQLPPGEGGAIDTEAQHLAEESADGEGTEAGSGSGSGKVKRPPSAPKYTFMEGLNLAPEGVPSLKDYCTERGPQTERDKFLVASAWIQTHGGTDPFTGQHLFTCFRAIEWKTQADMIQPLRHWKSKKSYYESPNRGEWRLTNIGLDAAKNIKKE